MSTNTDTGTNTDSLYYGDTHLSDAVSMGRWASGGATWHRHSIVHVHTGGEDDKHTHIVASAGVAEQLDGLLARVIEGTPLPSDIELARTLRTQLLCER